MPVLRLIFVGIIRVGFSFFILVFCVVWYIVVSRRPEQMRKATTSFGGGDFKNEHLSRRSTILILSHDYECLIVAALGC